MNNPAIKWLVGGLLVLLLGWALSLSIEVYDEIEESGWSRAALLNPYLAVQQFLERSGVEVTDVENLAQLDRMGGVGTLFFSDGNQVQSPRQLRRVMEWLNDGGNVIYSANQARHEDDLLLAEFEVEVDWRDDDAGAEERSLADTMRDYNREIEEGKSRDEASEALGSPEQALTEIRFDQSIGTLEAAFDTSRVLLHASFDDGDGEGSHQPFSWSSSNHGVHMMQFEVGEGLLTIVSDPLIWTSASIERHDHAWLIWLLISTDGGFAMLSSVVRETLWQMLLDHAFALLFASALLIALAIWRAGQRFGAVASDRRSRGRAMRQHFSALSMYLWQRRDAAWLIGPLRQRVWHRASLVMSGFASADRPRQFELLADHAQVNADAIARAFDSEDFNETAFVHTVRLLKRIEQSL